MKERGTKERERRQGKWGMKVYLRLELTAAASGSAAAAGSCSSLGAALLKLALWAWASSKACLKRLASRQIKDNVNDLNLLYHLMQRIWRGRRETVLTFRVTEPDSQGLGGSLTLGIVGSDVVDPRSVRTDVGRKLHVRRDCYMSNRVSIH